MVKRLQILVFVVVMMLLFFISENYLEVGGWAGWLLGAISVLFTLLAVFIGFVIFLENRHPTKTLTWLVVLGTFPLFGFIFYLLFGQSFRKKKIFREKAMLDEQAFMRIEGNHPIQEDEIAQMGDHQKLLFRLAHRIGHSPISFATETKVLTDGEMTFESILEELKKAEHHIHLEYYIVRDKGIAQDVKNILIEKAQSGVQVRFLYDAVGSWMLSNQYIEELRSAGVEMVPFAPVRLPFLSNKVNFRNHRKIIVIDGNIGFVGGLNIGDEYLGKDPYFGYWRDTHLYVRGEAVRSLQIIFLQDWYYTTGKALLTPEYLSPELPEGNKELGGVQMLSGGPGTEWEVIKHVFFSMIVSAKKSIWIASPYFIPDEDILSALKTAALSGVDVKLLVPSRPDKKIVFHASRSYFPELLQAGVEIYEYRRGFMHSKIIIVDHELASIGTANMDMRSFHLNFEVNAFLYRTQSVEALKNDFLSDIKYANEIRLEVFQNRPLFMKVFESTARLLSPLL